MGVEFVCFFREMLPDRISREFPNTHRRNPARLHFVLTDFRKHVLFFLKNDLTNIGSTIFPCMKIGKTTARIWMLLDELIPLLQAEGQRFVEEIEAKVAELNPGVHFEPTVLEQFQTRLWTDPFFHEQKLTILRTERYRDLHCPTSDHYPNLRHCFDHIGATVFYGHDHLRFPSDLNEVGNFVSALIEQLEVGGIFSAFRGIFEETHELTKMPFWASISPERQVWWDRDSSPTWAFLLSVQAYRLRAGIDSHNHPIVTEAIQYWLAMTSVAKPLEV